MKKINTYKNLFESITDKNKQSINESVFEIYDLMNDLEKSNLEDELNNILIDKFGEEAINDFSRNFENLSSDEKEELANQIKNLHDKINENSALDSHLKEALKMDLVNDFVSRHLEDFLEPEEMPLDDQMPDVVDDLIMNMNLKQINQIIQKAEKELEGIKLKESSKHQHIFHNLNKGDEGYTLLKKYNNLVTKNQ